MKLSEIMDVCIRIIDHEVNVEGDICIGIEGAAKIHSQTKVWNVVAVHYIDVQIVDTLFIEYIKHFF